LSNCFAIGVARPLGHVGSRRARTRRDGHSLQPDRPPVFSPATPSACPALDHPPEERMAVAGLAVQRRPNGHGLVQKQRYLPAAGGVSCLMPPLLISAHTVRTGRLLRCSPRARSNLEDRLKPSEKRRGLASRRGPGTGLPHVPDGGDEHLEIVSRCRNFHGDDPLARSRSRPGGGEFATGEED